MITEVAELASEGSSAVNKDATKLWVSSYCLLLHLVLLLLVCVGDECRPACYTVGICVACL